MQNLRVRHRENFYKVMGKISCTFYLQVLGFKIFCKILMEWKHRSRLHPGRKTSCIWKLLVACFRRSDSRAREKNSRRKKIVQFNSLPTIWPPRYLNAWNRLKCYKPLYISLTSFVFVPLKGKKGSLRLPRLATSAKQTDSVNYQIGKLTMAFLTYANYSV